MDRDKVNKEKNNRVLVLILSIAIPLVVAVLFNMRIPGVQRLGFLPPIYATINGITAILLVIAYFQIRKGNRKTHEKLMKTSIVMSVLFLLMYILYHMTSDPIPYGGEGILKNIYFFVLISHVLMSIGVIPMVLISYFRALRGNFGKHRKIARVALPLWLYVAVSGVIVYIMISPYY